MSDIIVRNDRVGELLDLMADCAEAMYDGAELNVSGNGVNAFEAARPLQAVAEILGIKGPQDFLNQLCGEPSR